MNKILFLLCLSVCSLSNAHVNESLVKAIEESNWQIVDAELAKTASWTQETKEYYINLANTIQLEQRQALTTNLNQEYRQQMRYWLAVMPVFVGAASLAIKNHLDTLFVRNKTNLALQLVICFGLGCVTGGITANLVINALQSGDILAANHLSAIYIFEKLLNSSHIEIIASPSPEIAS